MNQGVCAESSGELSECQVTVRIDRDEARILVCVLDNNDPSVYVSAAHKTLVGREKCFDNQNCVCKRSVDDKSVESKNGDHLVFFHPVLTNLDSSIGQLDAVSGRRTLLDDAVRGHVESAAALLVVCVRNQRAPLLE
ncbi:hypothetical protein F2P81_003121 [Scophthalmus maximus]|uniref:Uncharacterized protein n=1 Tax=Scophthalmus maximus TaxID=52904 RepID=A0A6A4TDA4_SCOMX|nr:hypothetical protein F2P81_003121 [Scophthalmus maximus]